MENKKRFIEIYLLLLLREITPNILTTRYLRQNDDNEYVIVEIASSITDKVSCEKICITADSLSALTTDVINYLF